MIEEILTPFSQMKPGYLHLASTLGKTLQRDNNKESVNGDNEDLDDEKDLRVSVYTLRSHACLSRLLTYLCIASMIEDTGIQRDYTECKLSRL